MIRKWICLALALWLLLPGAAQAAEEARDVRPFLMRTAEERSLEQVRQTASERKSAGERKNRPHIPLIGAMGIGFSVAALMAAADQRKK